MEKIVFILTQNLIFLPAASTTITISWEHLGLLLMVPTLYSFSDLTKEK